MGTCVLSLMFFPHSILTGIAALTLLWEVTGLASSTVLHRNITETLYTFDEIKVVSAGERDPDAEGVEGMSASKMRKAAVEG